MKFNEYFPGGEKQIISCYEVMFEEVLKDSPGRDYAVTLLNLLKYKSEASYFHYVHSLRVTVTSTLIASMMYMQPQPAFYSGMLHDVGKAEMPNDLLDPPDGIWTEKMAKAMQAHVDGTHRLLRGSFDYIDKIVTRHHIHQKKGYPKRLPTDFRSFEQLAEAAIPMFSVILSIADVYDAMHRYTDQPRDGEEIKELLIASHPGWRKLIEASYRNNVFTTWTEEHKTGDLWVPPTLNELEERGYLI